jgi:hypothetical protein
MITPPPGQVIEGIRAIQTLREVREVREVATPTGQEARRESYYAFKTLVIKTLREVRRLPNDRRTQPRQILRVPIARTRKRIAADPREDRLRQLTAPRTQPHRPVIKTLRPWFLLPLTVSKRYLPKSSLKQQSAVLSQRDAPAPTLNDSYFFLVFFTAPYFLRAAFSQPERLEPCFLWQAFSALASFAARSCAAVLAFGQPVTSMWVSWLRVAPFCATNAVGMMSFCWQRLPLAASAEYLPWGRFSSKLLMGCWGLS